MADYSVTFSELDALLQSLEENTTDTPYDIEITEITNEQCSVGFIQAVLQQNNTKFISLSFSDNCQFTIIGYEAFAYISNLISIVIPDYVVCIEYYAFENSSGLKNVFIPDSVLTIGTNAFKECRQLETIRLPNSLTIIESQLFIRCNNLLEVIIPNSVTRIKESAFHYCKSLTSVTIPNSVETIEQYAFAYCENLVSVSISSSVKSIGKRCFIECPNLEAINVDSNNSYYKSLNGNLYDYDLTTIIQYAIGKTDVSFEIPNTVTVVKEASFYKSVLENIIIPNSLRSIENSAFYRCVKLTAITLPNTLEEIGDSAFYQCEKLENIKIPNSVCLIGNYAFFQCIYLTNVILGCNRNLVFSSGAFYGCLRLETVTFPHKFDELEFKSIGSDIFKNCLSLTDIHVYDQVTKAKFIEEYETAFGLTGKNYIVDHEINSLDTSNMNSALSSLDANTIETSYKVNVAEVSQSSLNGGDTAQEGTLQYILQQNPTKYVSVVEDVGSYTEPITSMEKSFKNCTNLVSFKGLPSTLTNMNECFKGCTSLTEVE